MRVPQRLRTILVCTMLEFAALAGVPMRPEEIEELMRQMNQPKLAHVIPDESEHGDGDPEPEPPNPEPAPQNPEPSTKNRCM